VAARTFAADSVQIDEHRAWDVTAEVSIATLPAGQIPAEIDDPKIPVRAVIAQPFRADERTEVAH
jgi:hypothetical protein